MKPSREIAVSGAAEGFSVPIALLQGLGSRTFGRLSIFLQSGGKAICCYRLVGGFGCVKKLHNF